jgi:CheY-like chemotaxis protein
VKVLRTVLYVEDDPDIQEVARLALEIVGGLEVIVASSGSEALRLALNDVPDLVLLDVMMPGMDGPTTLTELRKVEGMDDVPVIFVTAKVQSSEIQHYISLGAVGVIAKPFNPMTLADEARAMWEFAAR